MVNKQFEAYKLKRELKRSGIEYQIKRTKVNDFGEPASDVVLGVIKGIYHEQNGNIQITTGDTTQVRTKKVPMMLCLYEDVALLDLKAGDKIIVNSKSFKVIGVVNIQEWSIISDISLEVIDDGS